ncbi:hypothetical protein L198_01756 [Cryptococcus wingfieldii CBS 7118]|uniref:UBA domain-containing protein n=1 Tax=Cryptococcus wingfieldii CBS 7118 TaxID=1295528 RepID=A0A1E3JW37_9TREE|nr:hypothetical protein L198_01756 [Cryptococcus wingfieldii CBS 7118]ODO05069.1 hypothetical protein L198_01756 [Cryptococcus wingfieldii CBS 7118]
MSRPRSDLVDQLKSLGITERTALFALSKSNNDMGKARKYGELHETTSGPSFGETSAVLQHLC